ncbi:MAG: FAD-dependent thymidylate synthase [Candidatus Nealsonbacteria bacterium]
MTDTSATKFVEMLRKLGHESVLEFSSMIVQFNNVSRGFTHELVRHRLASYVQESTRRVDESDFEVVIPPTKDPDEKLVELILPNDKKIKVSFRDWMDLNEQMYRGLRKAEWKCEDSRQVIPIGIKSQIIVGANFREWRHIFKLRCAPGAHWEIRRVMINLLKDVQKRVPIVFDDFKVSEDGKSAVIINRI